MNQGSVLPLTSGPLRGAQLCEAPQARNIGAEKSDLVIGRGFFGGDYRGILSLTTQPLIFAFRGSKELLSASNGDPQNFAEP